MISQHQYIPQKLRELCRLVLEARKVTPVKTIKELIKPENYSNVVTATRNQAGYNDGTGKHQFPSLARKVFHSLHTLALLIKSEALKSKDKQTERCWGFCGFVSGKLEIWYCRSSTPSTGPGEMECSSIPSIHTGCPKAPLLFIWGTAEMLRQHSRRAFNLKLEEPC